MKFVDDGIGPKAFMHHTHDQTNNYIVRYGEPLNVNVIQDAVHWKIRSVNDLNYKAEGKRPVEVFRKSKVNGQFEGEYNVEKQDFNYKYTHEHFLYLKMPYDMKAGKSYTVQLADDLNSDKSTVNFIYDNHENISEAIHVNLVGYINDAPIKAADLYFWLGDGKYRDYKKFQGNKVWVQNEKTKQNTLVGNVQFGTKKKKDIHGYNMINSPVWTADFSNFNEPGYYKLVIEDVGCSHTFEIRNNIYHNPYKVSLLGFLYMRVGQDSTGGIWPVLRRPLYIPGKSPEDTRVYVTNLHPYSPLWSETGRDTWDVPEFFKENIKEGMPQNNQVKGGHADALDWDRHLGHVSIIYDLLLPYILSDGKLSDDNLGLPESGNGIPDIIDEARNEVDFWLSARYNGGYSHGISNPMYHNYFDHVGEIDSTWLNVLFQADNTPIAAWANAANASMLAYAFMIQGNQKLMQTYCDSALIAFKYASKLDDPMLDQMQSIGEAHMRGRDFRMTAAAYLYNLTGDSQYEDIVFQESVVKHPKSEIVKINHFNQLWGVVAYLKTQREVHYPELWENMKKAVCYHAKNKEVKYIFERPSRRATDDDAYFKTTQHVQRSIVAHAISEDKNEKQTFLKALILEADWGLGRNPLNMIEMTTATTELQEKRSIENMFTSGRDDGAPGLHPGHTPYLNTFDWSTVLTEGMPSVLTSQGYPDFNEWPMAEGYFNTRYMFAHSEFTPQQSMRGKTALYAYLYFIGINKTQIDN